MVYAVKEWDRGLQGLHRQLCGRREQLVQRPCGKRVPRVFKEHRVALRKQGGEVKKIMLTHAKDTGFSSRCSGKAEGFEQVDNVRFAFLRSL